jgi:hypothetical protein
VRYRVGPWRKRRGAQFASGDRDWTGAIAGLAAWALIRSDDPVSPKELASSRAIFCSANKKTPAGTISVGHTAASRDFALLSAPGCPARDPRSPSLQSRFSQTFCCSEVPDDTPAHEQIVLSALVRGNI